MIRVSRVVFSFFVLLLVVLSLGDFYFTYVLIERGVVTEQNMFAVVTLRHPWIYVIPFSVLAYGMIEFDGFRNRREAVIVLSVLAVALAVRAFTFMHMYNIYVEYCCS